MSILKDKNLLITGILTDASLAFGVAQLALDEGANIVITGAGRGLRLTEKTARKLNGDVDVLEFDVRDPSHVSNVRNALEEKWGQVDGALHAIGFMPEVGLGEDFLAARWDEISVGFDVSAYSIKTVAETVLPLMNQGGSIVGLDLMPTWLGQHTTGWVLLKQRLSRLHVI